MKSQEKKSKKLNEHQEQVMVMLWAKDNADKHKALHLLYAIPNGGHRHISVAKRLKAEGVKAGVPDLHLPVPNKEYTSLYIEMKSLTGYPSKKQKMWIQFLNDAGNKAVVCKGHKEAIEALKEYISTVTVEFD